MNAFQKKITLRVLAIHAAIIFLVAVVPLMRGCFVQKPREIVTFIEMGEAAPAVSVQQVANMTEPEPAPPDPEPAPIPEPVKKKPEPIKKKPEPIKKKPEPVKPKPTKPKWKPTKVDVSKSKVIKPSAPAITASDIEQELTGIVGESTTASTPGNPDADAAYISQIGTFFDRRWTKPESSAPAASDVIRIYMSKWGTITQRKKIQGSGDAAFDASVMSAVNSVDTVPKPPSSFPYDYVEVEFRIRN